MKLSLWCEVEAGTRKGGEDVNLWANISLESDGSDAALDAALVGLREQLVAELDKEAQEIRDENDGESPTPDDDELVSPDEEAVYVTSEQVFTGRSDHYEFQVVVSREVVIEKVLEGASDTSKWAVTRRYGQERFVWISPLILVDLAGNAD